MGTFSLSNFSVKSQQELFSSATLFISFFFFPFLSEKKNKKVGRRRGKYGRTLVGSAGRRRPRSRTPLRGERLASRWLCAFLTPQPPEWRAAVKQCIVGQELYVTCARVLFGLTFDCLLVEATVHAIVVCPWWHVLSCQVFLCCSSAGITEQCPPLLPPPPQPLTNFFPTISHSMLRRIRFAFTFELTLWGSGGGEGGGDCYAISGSHFAPRSLALCISPHIMLTKVDECRL